MILDVKDVEHNGLHESYHAPVLVCFESAFGTAQILCLEESLQPRHEELFARSLTPKQLEGLALESVETY